MPEEFDRHAENYNAGIDNPLKSLSASGQEDFWRIKKELLLQCLPKAWMDAPLSVLDYGCGACDFLDMLQAARPSWTVSGCDVSPKMLEEAARKFQGRPWLGRLKAVSPEEPLPEGAFDLISAVCVFHHIPPAAWPAALEKIVRALKPGGVFFMFEHNPWNPCTSYIVKTSPIDENAVMLSSRVAARLLAGSGLSKVSLDYFLFFPPRLKALSAFEKGLRWLPLGGQYAAYGWKPA